MLSQGNAHRTTKQIVEMFTNESKHVLQLKKNIFFN